MIFNSYKIVPPAVKYSYICYLQPHFARDQFTHDKGARWTCLELYTALCSVAYKMTIYIELTGQATGSPSDLLVLGVQFEDLTNPEKLSNCVEKTQLFRRLWHVSYQRLLVP